jgi:N-methylhydantoinase A
MLLSDTVKDYSRSVLKAGDRVSVPELDRIFKPLLETAFGDLSEKGFVKSRIRLLKSLDVRYAGQSYELTVPFSPAFRRAFDEFHLRRYGYSDEKRSIELVNLRVKAVGLTDKPVLPRVETKGKDARPARIDRRPMRFDGRIHQADVYGRDRLGAGNVFRGPALILDYESTAVVPPDFAGRVDGHGNLILTPQKRQK